MVNCKADQEINPKTGRCIKKCAPGTIRNPNTGRCIKAAAAAAPAVPAAAQPINKSKSATKKKCAPGQEINPNTGRCVKKCAAGTIRNPKTGRCIKAAAAAAPPAEAPKAPSVAPAAQPCPAPDQEINPNTGRCVKKCAAGTVRNPKTGRCIKTATVSRAPRHRPLTPEPLPPSKESLITSADVKKRALFLNTICSDSGICLAFGKEDAKIKKFFDGFNNFTYLNYYDIRRVGAVSANGFVNMLEYKRQGYKSHAILKSSMNSRGDNLYYEYLVGRYFVNRQKRKFPCFVETYGLFMYTNQNMWSTMKEKDKPADHMKDYINRFISNLKHDDPNNVRQSCLNPKYLCILIENIKGAKTVSDMITDKTFIERDILNVLFQIYGPLSYLAEQFTHYDLHSSNVLIYSPFEGDKYIEFHYHLEDGQTISFKSKYIAKIIDYGRCYYTNTGGNHNSFYYNSKTVLEKVCSVAECNENRQKCGDGSGYGWLKKDATKKDYYISSKTNNISHDLRFLKIVTKKISEEVRWGARIKTPEFLKTGLFDKIVYSDHYGTREIKKQGYDIKNPKINNVYDAFDALKHCMQMADEVKRNNDLYRGSTKMGDLHIYFDGRDMQFQG